MKVSAACVRIENGISRASDGLAPREPRARAFVSAILIFFLPFLPFFYFLFREEAHSRKKQICRRILQSRLLHELSANRMTDCTGDSLQRATIDQSARLADDELLALCDSQNCAFARFRSPRLFMEAMQFTDNPRVHARMEKNSPARPHAHTHTHSLIDAHAYFAPRRHGVN